MTDDDVDTQLRAHGMAWRAENSERPAVDWDEVTPGRRWKVWLGVAGVSVAAAAIVIPVVLTSGRHTTSAPTPASTPHPYPSMSLSEAQQGAPKVFYALHNGGVSATDIGTLGFHSGLTVTLDHLTPSATVAEPLHKTALVAYPRPQCETKFLDADAKRVPGGLGAQLLEGQPVAAPMAVSPDGKWLALIVHSRNTNNAGHVVLPCGPDDSVAIVNIKSYAANWIYGETPGSTVSSLQWGPDSRSLAYVATYPGKGAEVQVFNRDSRDPGYDFGTVVATSPKSKVVFWWHGQLVMPYDGALHLATGAGGLGRVVATGFPDEVDSVSAESSGDHDLISSGGTTYRWDKGQLSQVRGDWRQPTW